MIGAMRDRVEILRPVRQPDEGGGFSIGYTSLGTVSAKRQARSARTDRSLDMPQQRRRERFVIRYRDDMIFEMRLVHRGRQFRVTDIQDQDDKSRFTLIEGEEINA